MSRFRGTIQAEKLAWGSSICVVDPVTTTLDLWLTKQVGFLGPFLLLQWLNETIYSGRWLSHSADTENVFWQMPVAYLDVRQSCLINLLLPYCFEALVKGLSSYFNNSFDGLKSQDSCRVAFFLSFIILFNVSHRGSARTFSFYIYFTLSYSPPQRLLCPQSVRLSVSILLLGIPKAEKRKITSAE